MTSSANENKAEELTRLRQAANYWKAQHSSAIHRISKLEKKHNRQISALRKKLKLANEAWQEKRAKAYKQKGEQE